MSASPSDVTDMLVFARVVEEKSFTAAAHKLALSKSVVSSRVAALEERLGVRLLHRTTRRLTLTDDGVRFYDRSARMAAEADEAVAAVEEAGGAVRGNLRMTAPAGFAQRHLVAPLGLFLERWPEVRLEVSTTDRRVDLTAERYDFAVRITASLTDPTLTARRLASDRGVVCASPAYLARHGVPTAPAELVHHVCLRYTYARPRNEWVFEGEGRPLELFLEGPLVASSGGYLREAAIAGQGIAILPENEVADELAAGRLVPLLEGFLRAHEAGIFAVHPYGRKPPARVRALTDVLVEWFRVPRWKTLPSTSPRSSRSRSASAPR